MKAITAFSVVHTNKLPVLPLNTFPPILNSVDLTQKKGVNIGGGLIKMDASRNWTR